MKIGIDGRLWSQTGVGRYIKNLIIELIKIDKNNSYFIFVKSNEKELVEAFVKNKSFQIIPTKIKWHSLKEQTSFAREIEKYNLDLMHFTYFSLPINYKRKFVVTIHDLIIHHFPTGKASTLPSPIYYAKRFAYIYLIQKSADKANSIIAVSQSTKNEIVDHLRVPATKIKLIYEGVDDKVISQKGENIIGSPYLLYAGNAYPHKNLKRLIQAFEKAMKNNEKLVLVGEENFFYKRINDEIIKNNFKNIILFGKATDEELASLYVNAKAFVMPSLMEGFGLPPLEAMANGCFVIASNIPSIKEICKEAAIYFDPYDISDITDKIQFAFSANDKSKYIQKGRKRVEDFSWAKMAKETLKVYEDSFSLRPGQ
jgi:glycosyltransferase involved in cell wall biosynthesis